MDRWIVEIILAGAVGNMKTASLVREKKVIPGTASGVEKHRQKQREKVEHTERGKDKQEKKTGRARVWRQSKTNFN